VGYINKVSYTDKVGYRVSKVKVGVLIVLELILALLKLFLRR